MLLSLNTGISILFNVQIKVCWFTNKQERATTKKSIVLEIFGVSSGKNPTQTSSSTIMRKGGARSGVFGSGPTGFLEAPTTMCWFCVDLICKQSVPVW